MKVTVELEDLPLFGELGQDLQNPAIIAYSEIYKEWNCCDGSLRFGVEEAGLMENTLIVFFGDKNCNFIAD